MNKIVFYGLIMCCSVGGCSPVKLLDTWSAKNFDTLVDKYILVIALSPDSRIRQVYEMEIVDQLNSKGVDAIGLHKKFPDIKDKKKRTEGEVNDIVKEFIREGVQGIVITSLKQVIETENPTAVPEKSDYSFSFEAMGEGDVIPEDSFENGMEKIKSTTYVLEAKMYDLTLPATEQLVNVSLVDITDPESGVEIQKQFAKIIGKQFKK